MNSHKNKLSLYKHRIKDWTWNNRGILVPGGTGLASIIWFIVQPSPEPMVLLSTTFLAAFVLNYEKTNRWYTITQGYQYEIFFRADTSKHEDRLKLVNDFIDEFSYVYKWAFLSVDGDSLNRITVDTLDNNDKDIILRASNIFSLYGVRKDGRQIHERGIG